MRTKIIILVFIAFSAIGYSQTPGIDLSCALLENVRNKESYKVQIEALAKLDKKALAKELNTDQRKKTFWINVYNAFVQIYLTEKPELFEDRGKFFGDERTTIAGKKLSFDDIEHGIIRGSKIKLSMGMANKIFVNDYEKTFRIDSVDGRVHFILNCGAKSCPYIGILYPGRVEQQLERAASEYLKKITHIEDGDAYTTALFSWFRGDFGGMEGVKLFLKKYEAVPDGFEGSVEFDKYDWTLELGNFKDL